MPSLREKQNNKLHGITNDKISIVLKMNLAKKARITPESDPNK